MLKCCSKSVRLNHRAMLHFMLEGDDSAVRCRDRIHPFMPPRKLYGWVLSPNSTLFEPFHSSPSQVEMDATEKELISDAAAAAKPPPPQPPLPSEPPAVPPPVQGGGAMREADEPEEIRLVRGYQRQDPRVLAAQVAAHKMVLSPITGELVPVDQVITSAHTFGKLTSTPYPIMPVLQEISFLTA